VLNTPHWTRGAGYWLDLRRRYHGCSNSGQPQWATGAFDPDGDELDYMIVACPFPVFNQKNELIKTGEWFRFPKDDTGEQHAVATFFVGRTDTEPPYPFAPKSCCDAVVSGGYPDQPESCGDRPDPIVFTYAVRDSKGAVTRASITLG